MNSLIFGKYFLLFFNFQGLTSFRYKNGFFSSAKFLKVSNLIIPMFFLIFFFTYSTSNENRIHEILKVKEDLKISKSLKLIFKFFLTFQRVTSLALLIMFYRKQKELLRCFNLCSKAYHVLEMKLKFSDIIPSVVISLY